MVDTSIPLRTRGVDFSQGIAGLSNAIQQKKNNERLDRQEARQGEFGELQKTQILQQIEASNKTQSFTDMAADAIQVRSLLNAGDVEGARRFAIDRVSRLNERRKTDPSVNTVNTERFIQALEQDPQQAAAMLNEEIKGLQQLGFIQGGGAGGGDLKANAPVLLVNDDTKETMLAFPTINTKTSEAKLEPASLPPGFRVSTETPEQKRNQDLLAAQQKKIDELQAKGDFDPKRAADIKAAEAAVNKADKAFEKIDKIRGNVVNLRQAREAVLSGAGTGPIQSLLPSFTAASVALDAVQGQLGLDVVQSTTFGALSKGELDLSKAISLPTGLDGGPLIEWIDNKIAAQDKLSNYLEKQAIFLSERSPETGKQNTIADWHKKEKAVLDQALNHFGATEDDIKQTMAETGMDRSAVLSELRNRFENGGP